MSVGASVFVIGIAGASASGKSTLAASLAHRFNTIYAPLSMDSYYLPTIEAGESGDTASWELPSSLDAPRFQRDVEGMLTALAKQQQHSGASNDHDSLGTSVGIRRNAGTSPILILEGFLLFYFPVLAKMCHLRIWLEPPMSEVLCQRRWTREGKHITYERFQSWFNQVVWTAYETNAPMQVVHAQALDHGACAQFLRLSAELPTPEQVLMSEAALAALHLACVTVSNSSGVSALPLSDFREVEAVVIAAAPA